MRRLRPSQGAMRLGSKNGRGRTQGTKDRAASALAEAVMLTEHQVGDDNDGRNDLVGYLCHIARIEPNLFLRLWAAIELRANESAEV
jgi:hypothetical protein